MFKLVFEFENGERFSPISRWSEAEAKSLVAHFSKQLFNEEEWQPLLVRVWKERV